AEADFQKRNFWLLVWSRSRLNAIRMSQVPMLQSPRNCVRVRWALSRQSWVIDSAASRSEMEKATKRNTLGLYARTRASISSSSEIRCSPESEMSSAGIVGVITPYRRLDLKLDYKVRQDQVVAQFGHSHYTGVIRKDFSPEGSRAHPTMVAKVHPLHARSFAISG